MGTLSQASAQWFADSRMRAFICFLFVFFLIHPGYQDTWRDKVDPYDGVPQALKDCRDGAVGAGLFYREGDCKEYWCHISVRRPMVYRYKVTTKYCPHLKPPNIKPECMREDFSLRFPDCCPKRVIELPQCP